MHNYQKFYLIIALFSTVFVTVCSDKAIGTELFETQIIRQRSASSHATMNYDFCDAAHLTGASIRIIGGDDERDGNHKKKNRRVHDSCG